MILKFLALFFFLSPAWGQSHWRSQVLTLPASPVVLLGEQHDASEHQELAKLNLALLMRSHRLSALALEMADEGLSTRDIDPQADEATVRNVLKWNECGYERCAMGFKSTRSCFKRNAEKHDYKPLWSFA